MSNFIRTENDGPRLVSSNYWESQASRDGYLYLTPNAGAWRLLVPAGWKDLTDAQTARGIAITRGFNAQFRREMLEILFDDGTDSPFALFMGLEMVERVAPAPDMIVRPFVIYGPGAQELFRRDSLYRVRKTLPCLDPWDKP